MKEPKVRLIEKSDLNDLIKLCELHAVFEQNEFNSKNKKQKLEKHLFSDKPTLFCLVVEHLGKNNWLCNVYETVFNLGFRFLYLYGLSISD